MMDQVPPAVAAPILMNVGSKLVDRNIHNALKKVLAASAPANGAPQLQVSIRTGRSFVMLAEAKKAADIAREDLVEVADYDPARHVALYVGKTKPSDALSLFWFLYRAFEGVNAIAILPAPEGSTLPKLEPPMKHRTPQACMGALPFFKSHRAALLGEKEAIYLLRGLDELGPLLRK